MVESMAIHVIYCVILRHCTSKLPSIEMIPAQDDNHVMNGCRGSHPHRRPTSRNASATCRILPLPATSGYSQPCLRLLIPANASIVHSLTPPLYATACHYLLPPGCQLRHFVFDIRCGFYPNHANRRSNQIEDGWLKLPLI